MVTENKRKRENFCINVHLTHGLGMEFTACQGELMPEKALTLFTVCDAYRYFADYKVGQAQYIYFQQIINNYYSA